MKDRLIKIISWAAFLNILLVPFARILNIFFKELNIAVEIFEYIYGRPTRLDSFLPWIGVSVTIWIICYVVSGKTKILPWK